MDTATAELLEAQENFESGKWLQCEMMVDLGVYCPKRAVRSAGEARQNMVRDFCLEHWEQFIEEGFYNICKNCVTNICHDDVLCPDCKYAEGIEKAEINLWREE